MAEAAQGLLVAGVGGQGVVLAGSVVAAALLRQGYDVKTSESHGMAQRGGVVCSHVRFGRAVGSPLVPLGTADVLIALEWAEGLRWLPYLRDGGTVVAGAERVVPPLAFADRRAWACTYPLRDGAALGGRAAQVLLTDARAVASELGNARTANSVLLGLASRALDVAETAWEEAIRDTVPPRTVEANVTAFHAGRELVESDSFEADETPVARAPRTPPRIEITPEWCKSCDICVRVCPERCLALDAQDKVVAIAPDACSGCRLCELLCPDFAITIVSSPAPAGRLSLVGSAEAAGA